MKKTLVCALALLVLAGALGCGKAERPQEPPTLPAAAEPYQQRAVGVAGWSIVGAGLTVVAVAALSKNRPKREHILVPAAVADQQPEKITHSPVYVPPPHREGYRSNRRKI